MTRMLFSFAVLFALTTSAIAGEDGWESLFNGKDLTGWTFSENGKWEIVDGALKASGNRTHLFTDREFENFEFKVDVMTTPGSNAGVYFHTKYYEGWPIQGYESQVNVTHGDPVKTGSIYNVVKLYETPAKDNQYWEHYIKVDGKNIVVKIDGKTVIDYTEPAGTTGEYKAGDAIGHRVLSKGSFAFQQHDPKSVTFFKNPRVKVLPSEAEKAAARKAKKK